MISRNNCKPMSQRITTKNIFVDREDCEKKALLSSLERANDHVFLCESFAHDIILRPKPHHMRSQGN